MSLSKIIIRLISPVLVTSIWLASCRPTGPLPEATLDAALDGRNLSLAWSQSFAGPLNHPPLRVGDVLIVAPAQAPLAGLQAETGVKLWEFDPGVRIWDRAYASDGRRIYVGVENGRLIALAPETGEMLWQAELGINTQIPPLPVEGVVYVSTTFVGTALAGDPAGQAVLFALDAADGDVLWSFESGNYILQTPFLYEDVIYVAGSFDDPAEVDEGGHMRLYALDASDGTRRWSYESTDGYPKQLYATASAVAYVAYTDFTAGVDAATGDLLWRRDTGNWVPALSGSGDTIYYGSANTVVHAIQASTGDVVWQYNIPEGTFNYVIGAPVRIGDELIFLTQQGDVMSLNAESGELLWSLRTGISGARAGLSVSGNWIYIGDADGVVYGFSDAEIGLRAKYTPFKTQSGGNANVKTRAEHRYAGDHENRRSSRFSQRASISHLDLPSYFVPLRGLVRVVETVGVQSPNWALGGVIPKNCAGCSTGRPVGTRR